ncbi:MAG: SGNH/GDSL hydrolase family protein [Nocardioides sp.]|nr:SGNH/GDSL hydrolase family protein [Nocardioides sp.]
MAIAVWGGLFYHSSIADARARQESARSEPQVTAVLAAGTTTASSAPTPTPIPTPSAASDPSLPSLAVLGDTFTSGVDVDPADTWPGVLCRQVGCRYLPTYAVARTGYTYPGADGLTATQRVEAVVSAQPDIVVLAVGASDTSATQEQMSVAFTQVLDRLSTGLPQAQVVVLSPFWPSAPAPAPVITMRSWVYDIAVPRGVQFVNVTDLFDAAHADLVQPAGFAPDLRGHAYIAQTVREFVQAARDGVPLT